MKPMESWQIANRFVDVTLEKCREQDPEYCYARCVGSLQGTLSSIMIDLSICFPEAYEKISNKLLTKI
jgi:hypothetical protein